VGREAGFPELLFFNFHGPHQPTFFLFLLALSGSRSNLFHHNLFEASTYHSCDDGRNQWDDIL
jgi:hypothetical protein